VGAVLSFRFPEVFSKGTDGVLLFFMISGYCIALSAASSTSCWHFYAKRLGRLLPA
jgi:peptidoglycan/LPS O-acetylase OafA/YrhL